MTIEIELKYLININEIDFRDALRGINSSVIKDHTRTFHSIYYDTYRCLIRDAGLELRVRGTDNQFIQTLKSVNSNHNLVFEREETEHLLQSCLPELKHIDHHLKSSGLSRIKFSDLKPVFETRIERRSIDVLWRKNQIRIDIDNGILSSCRRKIGNRDLCEIELELLTGKRQDLLLFGVELNEVINLYINGYSKADLGYALAVPRFSLKPVKWEQVSAHIDDSASLKSLLSAALLQWMKNNPELLRDRLECIYQARVAIRRIRALLRGHKSRLEFLQRKGLNGELKWIQNKLGEARDWQVFQIETLPDILPKLTVNPILLEKYVSQQTKHHLASALSINSSPRLSRLVSRLAAWIDKLSDDPERDKKARAKRLDADIKKFVGLKRMPPRNFPSKIHELRIQTKKLRYMLEIGTLGIGIIQKRLGKEIKELQNSLGKFNDYSKALELLSPAKTSELPVKMNNEIRKILGEEMDKLFALSQDQFARVKALIRAIKKRR